jgi:hypothetical protein
MSDLFYFPSPNPLPPERAYYAYISNVSIDKPLSEKAGVMGGNLCFLD